MRQAAPARGGHTQARHETVQDGGKIMSRAARHIAAAAAILALAGCVEGQGPFAGGGGASATGPASQAATAQAGADVEAPEVFQATQQGLWDGRPSLGGVWVASAEATDPERVLIRNPGNGQSVVGALFRRERDNPGPPIQISSDAAAALGLLAGQPATISVTALRRQDEAPAAAAAAPATAVTATSETSEEETPAATGGALDTAAVAAAIDAADAAALPAEAAAAAAEAAPAPAPQKRRWWQRAPRPVAETAAVAEAPVGDPAALEADVAAVTTAPLEPAAAPAAASAPRGRSLIQLGIFSVEENAERAAAMVTKAGEPAQVREETSNGKTYWSVVAGPATTEGGRDALLAKIKGLGFTDAYFVSR